MSTLRFEGHERASNILNTPQIHQTPPSTIRHLPYNLLSLTLPAIRAILSVRSLLEYLIIPLAARTHHLTRRLLALTIPAAALLITATYQFLVVSGTALRLAGRMSRMLLGISGRMVGYVARVAVTRSFRKKLEREIYNFLLGPGNIMFKAAFWLAWWSLIGMFVSAPRWLLAA